MKDIIASSCVGIGQVIIGHPFDTAKILIQNKKQWFPLSLSRYYKGWNYPLFYSSIFNVSCFTIHERSYKYTQNHFISGLLSGMFISPLAYVLESFKIKYQINNKTHSQTIKFNNSIINQTIKQIKTTNGLLSLSTRETLAMGVYFQTYHELKKHINSTLICGGLTGITAWTLTYPMDVIASRQIAQNIKFKPAFLQKNLWKGINVCLTRAMIVNAVNFKIYESVMNSKHLSFLD